MHQNHLEPLEMRALLTATLDNGVLQITGSDAAETILVSENEAGQILVDITGEAQAAFNAADVTSITIDALGGDDTVTVDVNRPTTILGGAGADTITGSDGGNDNVIGQQGADTFFGRAGEDVFVWNPGDGSDLFEGGDGSDRLVFNGSNGEELFEISPVGERVKFFRDLGNINMDLNRVERIDLAALGGADLVSVRDTGGTGLAEVNIELEGAVGSATPDGAIDSIRVFGSSAADNIVITGDAATGIAITGTSALVNITHTDPIDTLRVDARGGSDTIDASGLSADAALLTLVGNTGHDTMLGSAGADTFFGGLGNDAIDGNRGNDTANMEDGNDTFTWDPGDGSDVIEGGAGFDTLLFNGSGGNEVMEASANGSRLRFTRDLGNINMDAGDTERLDVRAFGGNDFVTIGDLRATPTSSFIVDGGEGNDTLHGGPARETLVGGLGEDSIRGGSGNDFLTGGTLEGDDNEPDKVLAQNGNDTVIFGNSDRYDMGAGIDELVFRGTDNADQITVDFRIANGLPRASFITNLGNSQAAFSNGERITVDARGGDDTVVMTLAAGQVWRARFFGGAGNDLLIGGAQADILSGDAGDDVLLGLGGVDVLSGGAGNNTEVQ